MKISLAGAFGAADVVTLNGKAVRARLVNGGDNLLLDTNPMIMLDAATSVELDRDGTYTDLERESIIGFAMLRPLTIHDVAAFACAKGVPVSTLMTPD